MIEFSQREGGCNCGAVRYKITREPLTVYICHCHLCQKRTGGAFSMTMVLPSGAIEVTAGEPQCSERDLGGGKINASWVCAACHSRIWTQRSGAETQNLRVGTLDDTSGVRPVAQFWTSSAQAWALVNDNILSYEEQPSDPVPLLAAWRNRRDFGSAGA